MIVQYLNFAITGTVYWTDGWLYINLLFAVVPLPVLDKVHWQDIAPEFDPYKFNSFPVNASRQVNRATRDLQRALGYSDDYREGVEAFTAKRPPKFTGR